MSINEKLAAKIFTLPGSTILTENLANGVRVQFTFDRYHKSAIYDTEAQARDVIVESFAAAARDGFQDLFKAYADKEYHVIIATARTDGQQEGYAKLIEDNKVFGEHYVSLQNELMHMSGFDAIDRLTKARPNSMVYSGSAMFINIPEFSSDHKHIVAKIKFNPDFAFFGFILEATGNLITAADYETSKVYITGGKLEFLPRFILLNGFIRYIAFDINIKES